MTLDLPSDRTIRRNIWTALLSASDQEIHDGLSFYPGAYGLCRLFATIHNTTPQHVAAIYAATSPMNDWESNVTATLDVLQWVKSGQLDLLPRIRTTNINRDKACRIALGEDPLSVLSGRKVLAFYRAISNPDDDSHIPVDRHLICLALGISPGKPLLSRLANSSSLFSRLHSIYLSLGQREGIGNRLASIAWFVQRRISKSGQLPIPHPDSPICCNRLMWHYGRNPKRYYCSSCSRLKSCTISSSMVKRPSQVLVDDSLSSLVFSCPLSLDSRNRIRIQLGKSHPYANSAGYQWLSRFVVQHLTGERLRKDEHVHHENGLLHDCRSSNLSVWLAERHGRHHARHQLLYMLRDHVTGRFTSSDVPSFSDQIHDAYDLEGESHFDPRHRRSQEHD